MVIVDAHMPLVDFPESLVPHSERSWWYCENCDKREEGPLLQYIPSLEKQIALLRWQMANLAQRPCKCGGTMTRTEQGYLPSDPPIPYETFKCNTCERLYQFRADGSEDSWKVFAG